MLSLLELFVSVDDFCQIFLPCWERKLLANGSKKRRRAGQLSVSEIMTILIYFHQSQYRNFKAYYTEHVCNHLRNEFPASVSIPGVYGGVVDKFPIGAAFGKGLQLRMGQTHFHRYAKPLLDRVAAGEIDPSFVITHRVTLDELPAAFRMFNDKADACIKVVARP